MKVTTAQRLQELMKARGLRQVDILNMCQPYCNRFGIKLQKSDLSQYVSGKVEPSQYKLTILALALGVSETWLMGFDVSISREEKTSSTSELAEDEKLLLNLFRCVPEKKRSLVIEMIRVALNTK